MISLSQSIRGTTLRSAALVAFAGVILGTATAPAKDAVPFKGSISIIGGNSTPIFDDEGNFIGIAEQGSGKATHLGNLTADFFYIPTDPEFTTFDGTVVLTAANGDRLAFSFTTS